MFISILISNVVTLTYLNLVMNDFINQLFTRNSPVAVLSDQAKICEGPNLRSLVNRCLNFHKMNRWHHLPVLVVIIPLF